MVDAGHLEVGAVAGAQFHEKLEQDGTVEAAGHGDHHTLIRFPEPLGPDEFQDSRG
jgi:hypothetical protein